MDTNQSREIRPYFFFKPEEKEIPNKTPCIFAIHNQYLFIGEKKKHATTIWDQAGGTFIDILNITHFMPFYSMPWE